MRDKDREALLAVMKSRDCPAWQKAFQERGADVFGLRNDFYAFYKRNRPVAGIDTAQSAIELVVSTRSP